MLIGFFKKPLNCECYIIRYEDRIWLLENGDVQILRTIVVKTDANSPGQLDEIRMLLPFRNIINLEDLSKVCFLSPDENYFNTAEIYSTKDYRIIKEPPKEPQPKSFGVIRHDVGEDVRVFCKANLSSFRIRDCSVIRFQFPSPLKNGESAEIRLKFQVNSLLDKISPGLFPNYFIELSYFSPRHTQEIEQLNEKLEIKVKPILGLEEANFMGGYDIFLYLPPEFEEITGFEKCFKKKYDTHNINGKDDSIKRYKCLWRMRDLLKRKESPENKIIGIGEDIAMAVTFGKRYNEKSSLASLHEKTFPELNSIKEKITDVTTKIKKITKKVNQANFLGYAAIILALLSVLLSLVSKK